MLNSATMRFCTDEFGFRQTEDNTEDITAPAVPEEDSDKTDDTVDSGSPIESSFIRSALLESKKAWDFTDKLKVNGFEFVVYNISAALNKKIRVIFKIDDAYWTLNSSGALKEFTKDVTALTVSAHGNYPAALNALTDVPGFIGKLVYPIIGIRCPSDDEDLPMGKLAVKYLVPSSTTSRVQDSLVYELAEDLTVPRIISVTLNESCTGAGEVTAKIRLRTDTKNWTSWMNFEDAADQEATAVQFRFTYKVMTVNEDTARVNFVSLVHTFGQMVVSGENADVYSTIQRYDLPLQMCYLVVRHAPLNDSKIEAYVNFMHEPKHRELLHIGRGTGAIQDYVLGAGGVPDTNIDTSTLQVYSDAKLVSDYAYNSETGTVTFSTRAYNHVYASYDYDHDVETWRKMTLDVTEPYNGESGDCMSRFVYSLTDEEAEGKVISNVRLKLIRPTGKVTEQNLGTGLNRSKIFVLPHIPKAATIKFTDERVDWNYNENNNTLIVNAAKTVPMVVSYDWQGEPVKIYSFSAGWSVA